jgi:Mrp family chromosome partitioning ATPase
MFMLNATASQASMPPFEKFIIKTDNELIDVIGNKPGFNSPSEIFAGKKFEVFLKEYSKVYDYIFLEGPSLNNFSDTKELIDFCDGIIGVFSADKVLNQLDKESIEYFRNLNSKYIGSILNKVSMKNIS